MASCSGASAPMAKLANKTAPTNMPAKKPSPPATLDPRLDKLGDIGLKEFDLALRADKPGRKTKFVTFRGKIFGVVECQFKVPREKLQDVLDWISDREARDIISPVDAFMFQLPDLLRRELARANEKKPRGSQARRAFFVRRVKWIAPWVYCFLREVWQKRGLNDPLVAKAKTKLKTTSTKMSPRLQAIYLTAVLVSEADKDWYKLDLQDPVSDPG